MAKAKKDNAVAEWMYDIVREPVITEKSSMQSQHGQVTFRVPLTATKPQIKQAVEALFGVKVKAVNTSIQLGKTKRFQGRLGFKSDRKKAIISLEAGQNLDVGTGI
jgi:large subunit ribosomal protein L23